MTIGKCLPRGSVYGRSVVSASVAVNLTVLRAAQASAFRTEVGQSSMSVIRIAVAADAQRLVEEDNRLEVRDGDRQ